jgi:hypothetical protein
MLQHLEWCSLEDQHRQDLVVVVQRFAVIYPFVSSHCHYLWYCGQTLPIAIICGIVYKLRLQNS